ncbi:hypothetical protein PTKIN_Ptkin10aG0179000 [Pterospermum kingtungense]
MVRISDFLCVFKEDRLSSYETLTSYVVADNFRTNARERGFQIHDFEYSPEAQESRKQELAKLIQNQDSLRSSLLQWCYTCYGETEVMPVVNKFKLTENPHTS